MTKTALTRTTWREIPFWHTHDDRFLSISQMTTPHLINVMRQIVNLACEAEDIEPVPVKTHWAEINFDARDRVEWVALCRAFYGEARGRLDAGEVLSPGYLTIWRQVRNRILLLSARVNKLDPARAAELDEIMQNTLVSRMLTDLF